MVNINKKFKNEMLRSIIKWEEKGKMQKIIMLYLKIPLSI